MGITGFLADMVINVIEMMGYLGIFILMALESALILIPSEVIIPFSGFLVYTGKMNLFLTTSAGAFGNLFGSIIAYLIGLKGGRDFLIRYGKYFLVNRHHIAIVDEFFSKHGDKAVFFGRLLPAVRTVISFPAGIARMSFKKFIIYTLFGSYIWSFFLLYMGIMLRERWDIVEYYFEVIDYIVIIALVGLIIYMLKRRS